MRSPLPSVAMLMVSRCGKRAPMLSWLRARTSAEHVAATSTPPHALRERIPGGSVFDRWNGDGRNGLRCDGRNGLRPLADSCDVEGDQAEVRTATCWDDRGDDRTRRYPTAAPWVRT